MNYITTVLLPFPTCMSNSPNKLNSNFLDGSIDKYIGFEIEIRRNQSYLKKFWVIFSRNLASYVNNIFITSTYVYVVLHYHVGEQKMYWLLIILIDYNDGYRHCIDCFNRCTIVIIHENFIKSIYKLGDVWSVSVHVIGRLVLHLWR